MLINLENMLIFFSKRASGMLINDMLIKKHVINKYKEDSSRDSLILSSRQHHLGAVDFQNTARSKSWLGL